MSKHPRTNMSAFAFRKDVNHDDDDDSGSDDDNTFTEQREALTRFLCSQALPPDEIIESWAFKGFVNSLNPIVNLGTAESLKSEILGLYANVKNKIKQVLNKFKGQISLSVEVLKSKGGNQYVCITAHLIEKTWVQKEWFLGYYFVRNSVPEVIRKCLSNYKIEGKISSITSKSGRYHDEIVQMVKVRVVKKRNLQLNGRLFRVHCFADLLSAMAQEAFDEIAKTIQRIRYLINWGEHSPLWHVTHLNLKQALELHAKGEFLSESKPSSDEWKQVEGTCKLTELLYSISKSLSDVKNATAATRYLGSLQELRGKLMCMALTEDSFTKGVAEKLMEKLDKYLEDMFLVLAIASVMDPRYKMKFIEYLSSRSNGPDKTSKVSSVFEAVHRLFNEYPSPSEEKIEKSDYLECYMEFVKSVTRPPMSELDMYLEEHVVKAENNDFDVLYWWGDASLRYPTLSKMAADILSFPLCAVNLVNSEFSMDHKVDQVLESSGQVVLNALMSGQNWAQE